MGWWWLLWLLWPLSGLLGWTWVNYVISSMYPGVPDPPEKWWSFFGSILIGPCALLYAAYNAAANPCQHRWGLRFW